MTTEQLFLRALRLDEALGEDGGIIVRRSDQDEKPFVVGNYDVYEYGNTLDEALVRLGDALYRRVLGRVGALQKAMLVDAGDRFVDKNVVLLRALSDADERLGK